VGGEWVRILDGKRVEGRRETYGLGSGRA